MLVLNFFSFSSALPQPKLPEGMELKLISQTSAASYERDVVNVLNRLATLSPSEAVSQYIAIENKIGEDDFYSESLLTLRQKVFAKVAAYYTDKITQMTEHGFIKTNAFMGLLFEGKQDSTSSQWFSEDFKERAAIFGVLNPDQQIELFNHIKSDLIDAWMPRYELPDKESTDKELKDKELKDKESKDKESKDKEFKSVKRKYVEPAYERFLKAIAPEASVYYRNRANEAALIFIARIAYFVEEALTRSPVEGKMWKGSYLDWPWISKYKHMYPNAALRTEDYIQPVSPLQRRKLA